MLAIGNILAPDGLVRLGERSYEKVLPDASIVARPGPLPLKLEHSETIGIVGAIMTRKSGVVTVVAQIDDRGIGSTGEVSRWFSVASTKRTKRHTNTHCTTSAMILDEVSLTFSPAGMGLSEVKFLPSLTLSKRSSMQGRPAARLTEVEWDLVKRAMDRKSLAPVMVDEQDSSSAREAVERSKAAVAAGGGMTLGRGQFRRVTGRAHLR